MTEITVGCVKPIPIFNHASFLGLFLPSGAVHSLESGQVFHSVQLQAFSEFTKKMKSTDRKLDGNGPSFNEKLVFLLPKRCTEQNFLFSPKMSSKLWFDGNLKLKSQIIIISWQYQI